jgi:geranylgeranyl reductase family protein
MELDLFDVLIVGAGPAGSFAAEHLARGGARVALFDGRPEGEPKACGGGVTAKALKAWPHLLEAVGRTVAELDMYSPSGKRLHMKLDEPFAIYSRVAFDSYLRDRAQKAGAKVIFEKITAKRTKRTENGWTLTGANGGENSGKASGEWSGKILVGADGANSAIAKKLAGPLQASDMEVAFGYRAPLPEEEVPATVVAFLPDWDGYAWAFPRSDHVSFGIATSHETFDHGYLDGLLWDFIYRYYSSALGRSPLVRLSEVDVEIKKTQLDLRFDRYAARIPKLREGILNERKTVGSNWALLGDAAGFADAVTGEGIYYALRSAELFANCHLSGCLEQYEEVWRNDFGRNLARAARVRPRFYGSFLGDDFTNTMIRLARFHSGIRRTLLSLVAGKQGYVDLKRTLIQRFILPFG